MKKIFILLFGGVLLLSSCNNEGEADTENKDTEKTDTTTVEETSSEDQKLDSLLAEYEKLGISPESHPEGLAVGDVAPEVTMKTAEGENVQLAEFYNDQPVVVIFYRGYWCPVCNEYLSAFSERTEEITSAGAKVIAVTPETYENASTTIENTGINFTVISDQDGSVMRAFDVNFDVTEAYQEKIRNKLDASIVETNDAEQAVLPVPATYIINTDGKIVYRQFDPDYHNRASVDDILANLPE